MKTSLTNHQTKLMFFMAMLISISALTMRFLTYDRYLPFVDYSDEVVYIALADEQRGFADQSALHEQYGSLAPLYVSTNVIIQTLHDFLKSHPWHIPGEYLYAMRLFSVWCGVGTALTMAWIALRLSGRLAALLSGLIWSLSPIVVNFNSLAIPDPPLYFVCTLAVATAIAAWQRQSVRFLSVSLACGIAAIYLKLWIVTAIVPFVLASLGLLVSKRRAMLPRIAGLYGIALLFAAHFLIIINPLENTNKVSDNFSGGGFLTNLVDIDRLLNNLWHIVYPIDGGFGFALIVLGLGIVAYIYSRSRRLPTPDTVSLGIIGGYILSTWWLSAGISRVDLGTAGRMRHIFPVVVAFVPLWSVSLAQIIVAVNHAIRYQKSRGRLLRGAVIIFACALVVSFIPGDMKLIEQYNRSFTFNDLTTWFDSSPPHDGWVLMPDSSRYNTLWNRYWGAYMGSKPYDWWLTPTDEIPLSHPSDYRNRNIRWLVLSDVDIARANAVERLEAYLDDLLLVKTIQPRPGQIDGDAVYVYRFEPPQEQVDYTFGEHIKLLAYDLSSSVLSGGDTISFRVYWNLEQPLPQNLSMYIHIYSRESVDTGTLSMLTQWDGELLPAGNRPTSTWSDQSEVYFGEPVQLTIPVATPPGDYVLAVGLYNYLTMEHLVGEDGQNFFSIPLSITN